MGDPLFLPDGDRWVPQPLTRGPWSPNALHGGPVAALLARALEGVEAPGPMHPARLTVELMRPVPLSPLTILAEVSRPGRKVQWVAARLLAGDVEVARATMLRIRSADVAMPPDTAADARRLPFPGPEAARAVQPTWTVGEPPAYHNQATEHRAVRGVWGQIGPMTDWIRLRQPLVPGEAPSALQRVAAAADFGNGISSALPYADYSFINPDLTIHLHRLPVGEWVGLDAVTIPEASGVGLAESGLYDEQGRIGHSLQSLLIEKR